jgi:hypothetical protein
MHASQITAKARRLARPDRQSLCSRSIAMSIRSIPTLIALAAALAAPAAFAKHSHTPTGSFASSTVGAPQAKTRDQVEREVLQAQREGFFDQMRGEAAYAPEFQKATTSSLSRDEVQASVLRAQRSGYFDKVRGEGTYAPEFDRPTRSILTRSEVRQEVAHARHDGALDLMRGEAADVPAAYAAMKGD